MIGKFSFAFVIFWIIEITAFSRFRESAWYWVISPCLSVVLGLTWVWIAKACVNNAEVFKVGFIWMAVYYVPVAIVPVLFGVRPSWFMWLGVLLLITGSFLVTAGTGAHE